MAEPVLEDTPDTYLSFSSEFDSIAIAISPPPPPPPPSDNFCNSSSDQAPLLKNSISDLRFYIDDDGDEDYELNFEDSFNDLYFPSENESFFVDGEMSGDFTPASESSGDFVNEHSEKDTNGVLISTSSCYDRESPKDSDCSVTNLQSLSRTNQFDQKLNVEEEEEAATTSITTKRKKENYQEDTIEELRNYKYRRLDQVGFAEGDEKKRNVRLIRNRESAHLSRQRKRHYVEELEDKVKNMHSTITDLSSKMSYFMAENVTLRHQVGSGMSLLPRPGMYYPVLYPWMQCPAYMVKPQGSRVATLLPIPSLKPQQSVAKVKKFKKVASLSVLGLLFCLFLFGALAPFGEYKSNNVTDWVYDQSRGRVLDVNGHLDVSVTSNRAHCGRDCDQEMGRNVSATENSGPRGNSSEPLVASLFVPRNEKLVKIDGNLIIHSILASEKAMASETKNKGGKNDEATTNKGPMFSSGMCTDVFQFDISTTSGAIIPASPPIQQSENTTDTRKGKKNRRILRGGLPVSDFDLTKDHNSSSNENFRDTQPSPSMVVSVLVDPREGGDGMMGGTNPLFQVFIVLLVDGVKYVTYSCDLSQPQVPHLVTT
ncbi:PREDICTED: bZIP transcription factor 49-like [Camelina sativa]|uniref:BZIP transcription factor 49-like n=1 Tax=Camelina sativa TaxID=90675 RepID=A0ABM1RMY2_CAMSA|nr:PREDICTED: bZIP transcription factor 49-like [Camelina sativa]